MQATIVYADHANLPIDDHGDPRNATGLADDAGTVLGPPSTHCFITVCGGVRPDMPSFYKVVATVETDGDTERDCGELFERFNIGDHGGARCRSMSVGDIIVFGSGRAFCVQGCGWRELKNSDLSF